VANFKLGHYRYARPLADASQKPDALFGLLLDHGAPQLVFVLMAVFAAAVAGIVVLAQAAIAARGANARSGELPAE
jgi:hypothetical protein